MDARANYITVRDLVLSGKERARVRVISLDEVLRMAVAAEVNHTPNQNDVFAVDRTAPGLYWLSSNHNGKPIVIGAIAYNDLSGVKAVYTTMVEQLRTKPSVSTDIDPFDAPTIIAPIMHESGYGHWV